MARKIYYGNFQNKRRIDSKKRFIILLSVVIVIGVTVWLTVFFTATSQNDVAIAVKDNVQEITQLKLQLKEKDDKIALLEEQIANYEAELAQRPTVAPLVIEPPNEEVLSGQPTPSPTPKPTPKSTPKQTKKPADNQSSNSSDTQRRQNSQNNTQQNNTQQNNAAEQTQQKSNQERTQENNVGQNNAPVQENAPVVQQNRYEQTISDILNR